MTPVMRVRVERGPSGPGDFHVRASERVTAGRGRECALSIADSSMSRRHFELSWDGGACRLVDLGSSNGTYLNGARVQEAWLKDGDRIEAGATLLRVEFPPARPVMPPRAAPASAHVPAPPQRVAPPSAAPLPKPAAAEPAVPLVAAGAAKPGRAPVEIYAQIPPSQAAPRVVRPTPGTPLGELAMLLADGGDAPLYAVIDCAAALDLALAARSQGTPLYSLFESELAPKIGHAGPALVPLGTEPLPFLAEWASRAAQNVGVLLDASAPLAELYAHLVSLFEVSDARGNGYFRRFYDPRVLRPLIESTPPAERAALFGPVARFVVANEAGGFVAYARAGGARP